RLLWIAVPELVLPERDRCELRVGADRSRHDKLPDAAQPRLLEHVRAHHQVRVPVAARIRAVRADAADLRGEMDDELRGGVGEETPGALRRGRVVVGARCDEGLVARGAEALAHVRAEKAAAAGDEDLHACTLMTVEDHPCRHVESVTEATWERGHQ